MCLGVSREKPGVVREYLGRRGTVRPLYGLGGENEGLAMSRMSVSVVIPSFNCGSFVTQALDSALAQSWAAREIIVVDDGSTDDTRERLKPYMERIRYVFQENRGVSAARNRAVAESRGDCVAFLDADDVWHPRKLELQLKAFATAPDVGLLSTTMFHWPAFVFPELTEDISDAIIPVPWDDLAVKSRFGTSSVVVRRSTLERAGPFDTGLQGPEDRDMWLRVGQLAKMAHLDLPLTGYRSVPGSLSRRAATMEACERRILRKMDERRVWKGRWLLRRKSYSYLTFSCCNMYAAEGRRVRGLVSLLRSLAWYPFPYRATEVRTPLVRFKQFIVILLRMLGLKPEEPQPQAAFTDGRIDALEMLKHQGHNRLAANT